MAAVNTKTMDTKAVEVNLKPLDEVYFIEGKCGKILDILFSRGAAIKEFICHYKALKVEDAKLILIKHGLRFTLNPTGSVADYK